MSNNLKELFVGHDKLYEKLKEQAKRSFRTPEQQIVYYAWKCIDFIQDDNNKK